MNLVNSNAILKTLNMVAEDMKKDAAHYDGKEFNGRNVAEYLGKHGAAIAALAEIMKLLIADLIKLESEKNEPNQNELGLG